MVLFKSISLLFWWVGRWWNEDVNDEILFVCTKQDWSQASWKENIRSLQPVVGLCYKQVNVVTAVTCFQQMYKRKPRHSLLKPPALWSYDAIFLELVRRLNSQRLLTTQLNEVFLLSKATTVHRQRTILKNNTYCSWLPAAVSIYQHISAAVSCSDKGSNKWKLINNFGKKKYYRNKIISNFGK